MLSIILWLVSLYVAVHVWYFFIGKKHYPNKYNTKSPLNLKD